jgi:hypothetical protein
MSSDESRRSPPVSRTALLAAVAGACLLQPPLSQNAPTLFALAPLSLSTDSSHSGSVVGPSRQGAPMPFFARALPVSARRLVSSAADSEEDALRTRDATLARKETQLRAAADVAGKHILVSATDVISGTERVVVRAVAQAMDRSGTLSVLLELPAALAAVARAQQAYLRGDDNAARKNWQEAAQLIAAEGIKLGADMADLVAIGLLATTTEQGLTLGEVGLDLLAVANADALHNSFMKRLGAVRAERGQIRDRLASIASEVSGTSFDPSKLSPQAQANRRTTEEKTLLSLLDRGHREMLETIEALLNEQWRVQVTNDTFNSARLRLNAASSDVTASLAAAAARLSSSQLKRMIPAGWIPCTCPGTHPNAGLLIDGRRWHTSALDCSMTF